MSDKKYEIEALYNALEAALKEAAAYVCANGHRKKAELNDNTEAMEYHRKQFYAHIERFNGLVKKLPIRKVDNPDVLFVDFVANTNIYKHKLTSGKRKGQLEERTVSSARILGYRKIIKKNRKNGVPMSVQDIEQKFRETTAYAEISK